MKRECSYCNRVTRGAATHCGHCGRYFGRLSKTGGPLLKTEHIAAVLAGLAMSALSYTLFR